MNSTPTYFHVVLFEIANEVFLGDGSHVLEWFLVSPPPISNGTEISVSRHRVTPDSAMRADTLYLLLGGSRRVVVRVSQGLHVFGRRVWEWIMVEEVDDCRLVTE